MIMLQLTLKLHGAYYTDNDGVEVFDVDGSVLTPISVPGRDGGKIYSKHRFVYVVFKSDDKVDMFYNKGIFVNYSAIKTGNTIMGYGEGTEDRVESNLLHRKHFTNTKKRPPF